MSGIVNSGIGLPTQIVSFLSNINAEPQSGTFSFKPLLGRPKTSTAQALSKADDGPVTFPIAFPLITEFYPLFRNALPELFDVARRSKMPSPDLETLPDTFEEAFHLLAEELSLIEAQANKGWYVYDYVKSPDGRRKEAHFHVSNKSLHREIHFCRNPREYFKVSYDVVVTQTTPSVSVCQSTWIDAYGPISTKYYVTIMPEYMHIIRDYLNVAEGPLHEVGLQLAAKIYSAQQYSSADLGNKLALRYTPDRKKKVAEELELRDGQVHLPSGSQLPLLGAARFLITDRAHLDVSIGEDALNFFSIEGITTGPNRDRGEYLKIYLAPSNTQIGPWPLKPALLDMWNYIVSNMIGSRIASA